MRLGFAHSESWSSCLSLVDGELREHSCKHFNVVELIERIIGSGVFAFSAANGVSAPRAAEELVVAGCARESVVSAVASEEIVTNSAEHIIVASAGGDVVV